MPRSALRPLSAPRSQLALATASALAFLAHCSFPEYSFNISENEAGAAGSAPAGGSGGRAGTGGGTNTGGSGTGGKGTGGGNTGGSGTGGSGTAGDSVGGSAGSAGSGAGGCVSDCEFVVATATDEFFGLVSDGNEVFWAECDLGNFRCSISARAADGTGPTRVVSAQGQMPQNELVVDLKVDDSNVFAFLLDSDQPPGTPPHAIIRVPKAGGAPQTLTNVSPAVLFNYSVGTNFLFAFRENDQQPPGTVVRVGKNGNNNGTVTNNGFSLVGADGDNAVVIDNNGNLALMQPGSSTSLLSSDENPAPFPFEGLAADDAYYFLGPGQVRRLVRGAEEITILSANAGNDPFFLQIETDSLYWINRRGGSGSSIGDVHTVPKAGGAEVTKFAEDISTDALSVRNGVAYWISNDFTQIIGHRLR